MTINNDFVTPSQINHHEYQSLKFKLKVSSFKALHKDLLSHQPQKEVFQVCFLII